MTVQNLGALYTDLSLGLSRFLEGLSVDGCGAVHHVPLGTSQDSQKVFSGNAGAVREMFHDIMEGGRWLGYGNRMAYLLKFREAMKNKTEFPEEPRASRGEPIPSTEGAWEVYRSNDYKGALPGFRGMDAILSDDEVVGLRRGRPFVYDKEGFLCEDVGGYDVPECQQPTPQERAAIEKASRTGNWDLVPKQFWPNYMRDLSPPGSDGSIVQEIVLRRMNPVGSAVILERLDEQRTAATIGLYGDGASYGVQTAFVEGQAPEIIGYRIFICDELLRGILESLGLTLSSGSEAIENGIRALLVSEGLYNEEQSKRVMNDDGCQSGLCNVDVASDLDFLSLDLRRPQGSTQFLFSERLKKFLVSPLVTYCRSSPVAYEEMML